VYQKINLKVKVSFTAKALSKIKASTHTNASSFIEIGIRFNPVTDNWDPIFSESFENSFKASLDVKGELLGDIRLIPEINVSFYTVASASLYIEPFIKGIIGIENVNTSDGLILQPSDFDISLGLDSFAESSLDVLYKTITILPKTPLCKSCIEYPLFSLPKINLSIDNTPNENGKITLAAHIQDGVNNTFNTHSVKWETFAQEGFPELFDLGIENLGEGKYIASAILETCQKGKYEYDIFFSGFGILNETGRRFFQTEAEINGNDCNVIFVDDDANGTGSGLSREDAINSLEKATENKYYTVVHKIVILPGKYYLENGFSLTREMSLTCEDRENVYIFCNGNSMGNERSISNCNFIDLGGFWNCGIISNCTFNDSSSSSEGISDFANAGSYDTAWGEYFLGIITNCIFNNCSTKVIGGGVRNYGGKVLKSTFNDCFSGSFGGGVYNEGGFVENCIFNNCSSEKGGAVFNDKGSVVRNCIFNKCLSAVYNYSSIVEMCIFNYCKGFAGGGAYNSNATISNCIFNYCSVNGYGGGVFNIDGVVMNSIFNHCSAPNKGDGIFNWLSSGGTVTGCSFTGCSIFNYDLSYPPYWKK